MLASSRVRINYGRSTLNFASSSLKRFATEANDGAPITQTNRTQLTNIFLFTYLTDFISGAQTSMKRFWKAAQVRSENGGLTI